EVGHLALGHAERGLAVRRAKRLRAERLEATHEDLDVGRLVVDDEHAPEALHRLLRRASPYTLCGGSAAVLEVARQDGAKLRRCVWLGDEVVAACLDRARAV